ncbi:hypothetical protein B0H13DRAFT_2329706 [Mycena leptocephala]|nr:hypothetical protein B0H13DRAFT_2329706 [Mycena leptocephala]
MSTVGGTIKQARCTVETAPSTGLTTDHGVRVLDTDNWLKLSNGSGPGPALLEDHIAREKIHRDSIMNAFPSALSMLVVPGRTVTSKHTMAQLRLNLHTPRY